MNSRKRQITDTAIDLFAKRGIVAVSMNDLVKAVGVSKPTLYHHFKGGKQEIILSILSEFEQSMQLHLPVETEWMDEQIKAEDILSRIFFVFNQNEIDKNSKIVRIICFDQLYIQEVGNYFVDTMIKKHEEMLHQCFSTLVCNGKLKSHDTKAAARCLNRLILGYAFENVHLTNPSPMDISLMDERMLTDCRHLCRQIAEGHFS